MEEQSLEDILAESREVALNNKFQRGNNNLWQIIGIVTAIYFLFFLFESANLASKEIISTFVQIIFTGPFIIILPALFISIIPFDNWEYKRRLYRIFLILYLIFQIIMVTFLIVINFPTI